MGFPMDATVMLDCHDFGLPVPIDLGAVLIEAIDFSARDLFPPGSMDLNGWRVVGACRLRCPPGSSQVGYGALARRIDRSEHAVLLPQDAGHPSSGSVIPLPEAETLDWLTQLRSGHHGGAGRCQGNRAPDCSYPKQCSLKLPAPIVVGFTRLGSGQFSLGLRSHAALAADLMRQHEGALASVVTPAAVLDGVPTSKLKAYLDPVSVATYQALGAGAVARGIRVAYALLVYSGSIKPVGLRASRALRKGAGSRGGRSGKGGGAGAEGPGGAAVTGDRDEDDLGKGALGEGDRGEAGAADGLPVGIGSREVDGDEAADRGDLSE